jgi:hypothetical protein
MKKCTSITRAATLMCLSVIRNICILKTNTLILKRLAGYDSVGHAIWEKRAEWAIPSRNKKYTLAYGVDRCRQDGRFDSRVIGLINADGGRHYSPAVRVWVIDLEREKIEETKLANVECEDFSFGI